MPLAIPRPQIPKKCRLGPQNDPGSLEPEKLPRWKTVFRAPWNRWVATDIHLDQSSLLRKQWSPLR
jgi:hypothetical protein